jgi:RNA polymerase sigma factor (sigma-70 family)
MVRDVGLAEELAQDALVAALEQWPEKGIPENPGAWLMAAAKNRAMDHFRRSKMIEQKHGEVGRELQSQQEAAVATFDDVLQQDFGDDLLRLIFVSCHPVLTTEARVALTLRLLGGLTTPEIARAFLADDAAIAQRLVRAKRQIREQRLTLELPHGPELKRRLDAGRFRLVQVFSNDQAFLAVREEHFAVLVFRGTKGKELLDIDLNFRLVPLPGVPGVPGVMVHCGFLEVFNRCKGEIEAAVNKSVSSTLGFYITGHSLGGALAQIASAALNRDNLAACYTFGSPRVGTADFDEQVKCPHYRVINNWDLVPALPVASFRGYSHNGDPRLLTPKRLVALRRDRYASVLYNIAAIILVTLRTRKILINDDHMIWNYRKRLEEIASARAPAPASP